MDDSAAASPVNVLNLQALAAEQIQVATAAFRINPNDRDAAARLSQALDVWRRRAALQERRSQSRMPRNRHLPFELFLSQSFNPQYRDQVRNVVRTVAESYNMNLQTGDEILGRGRSARDIVRKINLRILDCDCFLCVVTPIPDAPKRRLIGRPSATEKPNQQLGSWFAFETALAYAYDKPLVIMSHADTFLATKPIFGWTEVRTFPDLHFDRDPFRKELNTAIDTLSREFLEQLRMELPR